MNNSEEISRLIDAVRSLEDRVRELEREDVVEGDPAIGFDVEPDGEDFDEDDSEYDIVFQRTGDEHFDVEAFISKDHGWNHFGE